MFASEIWLGQTNVVILEYFVKMELILQLTEVLI